MRLKFASAAALIGCLAFAAPTLAQSDNDGLGFGIRGLGPDASRGYFFFNDAASGAALRAAVRIGNVSDEPKEVLVRAQDAFSSGTGGLSYYKVKDGPGTWIEPREQRVTVQPGKQADLEFTINVPRDAKPGDHVAGIVAYDQAELDKLDDEPDADESVQLKFVSRLAVPVRVRVPGDNLVAEATLEDVKLSVTPSGSSVDIVFRNTGDVIIPASQGQVTVSQDGVKLTTEKMTFTTFSPGSKLTWTVPFEGAPAEATYRAQGFLEPQFASTVEFDESVTFGGEESEELERETGVTAIGADDDDGGGGVPAWIWPIAALILLLLAALIARQLRRRAQQRPAARTDDGRLDINTASVAELSTLPGVGPGAAQRIIAHREEFGRFGSVDELAKVEGFDEQRIAGLRDAADAG